MTAKEWLNRGFRIDREIQILEQEKSAAFERVTALGGGSNDTPVKTSKQNMSEAKYINYLAYTEKIDTRLSELYKVKAEIHTTISAVQNPIFRQLLELRYLQFKRWEQIAVIMNYSFDYVKGFLHASALREIKKITQNNT
jgi:hypothetical protein